MRVLEDLYCFLIIVIQTNYVYLSRVYFEHISFNVPIQIAPDF